MMVGVCSRRGGMSNRGVPDRVMTNRWLQWDVTVTPSYGVAQDGSTDELDGGDHAAAVQRPPAACACGVPVL